MTKRENNLASQMADPLDELLQRNLVKFIAESKYSMNQIADMVGVAQSNLGRYARGESPVPANLLKPLADFFGRGVGDFYDENPPPADPSKRDDLFLKTRPDAEIDSTILKEINDALARANQRLREMKLGKTKQKPKSSTKE